MQTRRRHYTGSPTLCTQSVLLTNGTTAPWLLHDHFTLQRATHNSHRRTCITPHCLPRDPMNSHIWKVVGGCQEGYRATEYLSTAEFWAVLSANTLPVEAAAALTGLLPLRSRLQEGKRSSWSLSDFLFFFLKILFLFLNVCIYMCECVCACVCVSACGDQKGLRSPGAEVIDGGEPPDVGAGN